MNHASNAANTHIALLCSSGLGDSLIQMSIANNLSRQGLTVHFYSAFAWQLRHHVNNYRIHQLPDPKELQAIFDHMDIVLFDARSPYILSLQGEAKALFDENAIAYRVSSGGAPKTKLSENSLFDDKQAALAKQFLSFNNSLRRQHHFWQKRSPVVDQIAHYLADIIQLDNVSTDTGLSLPRQTADTTKLLIHPSSSNRRKNWYPHRFIELAKVLKQDGLNPVFTVSPKEREFWQPIVKDDFDLPLFENVEQLAQFYSDASWFIGTDSGNAHLASCLGVPTLQIFNRWRRNPAWRAGWAPGKVLIAKFPYNLSRYKWSEGLSVERVYCEFKNWQKANNGS